MKHKRETGSRSTELDDCLAVAIDCLGKMALRKRNRLWAHDVRQLEDDLFEVLERLNNLKDGEHMAQPDVKSVRRDGSS